MLLSEHRREVVRVCRELAAAGLVVGTAGNVSVRDGDLIAVTPSAVAYTYMTPDLVGVHRIDGEPVEAPLDPTSEFPLHLAVYAASDAKAVVHTHSLAATALSTIADELPAIHYYVAFLGGPVRVSPYATFGTEELASNVVTALRDRSGCIMANHGAVTTGPDLVTAHSASVYLEWLCELYLRASAAGTPRLLPPEEIERVVGKLAGYGRSTRSATLRSGPLSRHRHESARKK
jgi:L-fuculose-phosphate aldolase